jgi:hypothetical protein
MGRTGKKANLSNIRLKGNPGGGVSIWSSEREADLSCGIVTDDKYPLF